MRILAKLNWNLQALTIDRVNDALEEKRLFTGIGRKPVILLQDNVRPDKAKKTLKT